MYKLYSMEETRTCMELQNCLRFVITDCGQKLLLHKMNRLCASYNLCNYDFIICILFNHMQIRRFQIIVPTYERLNKTLSFPIIE